MDQATKDILLAILEMIGQKTVYADCGADFPSEDWSQDPDTGESHLEGTCIDHGCKHLWDCQRQQEKVEQTKKIRAMIEGACQ